MQEFKDAPVEKETFNLLGHAMKVAGGTIVVGTIIGVITETLPLQSMANAAIGQYIAPFIGEQLTFFITSFAVAAFVIYLAFEHIRASKAAFSTLGKNPDAVKVRTAITGWGVMMLRGMCVFIILVRLGLTFVGSHQVAYMAIKPPQLNTKAIAETDSMHIIRNAETQKENEAQRNNVITANKQALQAAKKAAYASEANALSEVKNAKNEYRKGLATQKLKELRAANAEKLALISAEGSQALQRLTAQQNNVITANDSLNVASKKLTVNADEHAQKQFFWLSGKITQFLPYISLICILLVTIAVFVLCQIQRASGIAIRFEQDKYENVPGLLTVYYKAIADIWQSWNRAFAAGLKNRLEKDIFKGNTVAAGAIGAGNTVQVNGSGSVQNVTIAPAKTTNNAIAPKESVITANNAPERTIVTGSTITLANAETRLNTYKSRLARGEGSAETCTARINYYTHLIKHMKDRGIYQVVAPTFVKSDWV